MAEELTGVALYDAIGDVRLLVADPEIVDADEVFTDPQVTAFLRIEGWVVKQAAALALETLAVDLLHKTGAVRQIIDVHLAPEQAAAALRQRAADLRGQAVERPRHPRIIHSRPGMIRQGRTWVGM